MKNLLKMAVVALALSCFQAYGHHAGPMHNYHHHLHEGDFGCQFPCNKADAVCQARILYKVKEIIRVVSYGKYFLVTFVNFSGERKLVQILLDC